MLAPLIKPIRIQGGTFYTFSSAAKDLTLSFNNSLYRMRFSKFALLDIPNLVSNDGTFSNVVSLSNTSGAFTEIDNSKTLNDFFAESFQNYCLNLETMILSRPDFDISVIQSPAERVFFKWLKEIGAIRFREATASERKSSAVGIRYVEEDPSSTYSRVVKYIGDINVVNSLQHSVSSFTEVYVYIPSNHGNTPTVLFNSVTDANYKPNDFFTHSPSNSLDREYLLGRSASTQHPTGLSTKAFFDSDSSSYSTLDPNGAISSFYYWDSSIGQYVGQSDPNFRWWFPNPVENTYFLEPGNFGTAVNDIFKIESVNKTVEFKRSRLDGIVIEKNPEVYNFLDTAVDSFGKFAESPIAQSFEFNAILIYYDILNTDGEILCTNLFGVLFLDNVENLPNGNGGYIPRLSKYKSNSFTGDNGNSYGFRINLKIDVNAQDAPIESSVNEYNPFSLQLYFDVLSEMKRSVLLFEESQTQMTNLVSRLENIENKVLLSDTDLRTEVRELKEILLSNQNLFTNTENLLRLINRNYSEIQNIYAGKTSLDIAYNLDVIKEGSGIFIDRTDTSTIKIENRNQKFNLSTKPSLSILNEFAITPTTYEYEIKLREFTNYVKISDGLEPLELDRDVVIKIDDSQVRWKSGQTFRITFESGLNLNNPNGIFNFLVYTDSQDRLNTGFKYSVISTVNWLNFQQESYRPVIEIICVNPDTYKFFTDIF